MVLGKKVDIFDWEWGQIGAEIRPLEKGRKSAVYTYATSTEQSLYNTDLYTLYEMVIVAPKYFYHGILHRNYLRNEFDFWKDRGIMNTSGLLQSKWSPKASC